MVSIENCQEKTDEELVILTLADQEYFLYLMKRYEQKLLAYIKRITSISHEEAEDVLQETFIKTYLNLNNFDPDLKFSSWIYRIAHNEVINNFRKSKVRPSLINFEDNDVFIEEYRQRLEFGKEMDSRILKNNVKKF